MYREVKPEKLINKRGERSRMQVVRDAGGGITEQDIYSYEKGHHKPSSKKLPYLLRGLRATFDEISEPVDLSV